MTDWWIEEGLQKDFGEYLNLNRYNRDQWRRTNPADQASIRRSFDIMQKRTLPVGGAKNTSQNYGPFVLLDLRDGNKKCQLDQVSSLEELRDNVASILKHDKTSVLLFRGYSLKGEQNTNFERLTRVQQLLKRPGEVDGPILIRYNRAGAKTPDASPQQHRQELTAVATTQDFYFPPTFQDDIPVFYEDAAYLKLQGLVSTPLIDNPAVVLMAVPGAGKTRTVKEVAQALSVPYYREKLMDNHDFVLKVQAIAKENNGPPESYTEGKGLFRDACREFFKNVLEAAKAEANNAATVILLHFDEVQCLMGNNVVSSDDEEHSSYLLDYVMPSFGDVINENSSMKARPRLSVVLSGTSFFAPLIFNAGSHLKFERILMMGGFPDQFAKDLLTKFFNFSEVEEEKRDLLINDMIANRRAFQFLARELELSVGINNSVSEKALQDAADTAYNDWSFPIASKVGNCRSAAISLLAMIYCPAIWDATIEDGILSVRKDKLPWDVLKYALGGAVNVSLELDIYKISVPKGCTMRLLRKMCEATTTSFNMKEFESFRVVSKSVEADKGHLFERLVACEFTFISSRLCQQLVGSMDMNFARDTRVIGKSFKYHPTIQDLEWEDGTVYCVKDFAFNGKQLVDVGFPVMRQSTRVKVFCDLKVVQDQNELWRMCWAFFEKMLQIGVGESAQNTVVVFLSFHEFLDHSPQQPKKPVKKKSKASAHESRIRVLDTLNSNENYFAVVDGKKLQDVDTVLPLLDLYKIISTPEPGGIEVNELTSQVTGIYTSSSQQPTRESFSKRQKIS